jgi:hypothetical protein
MPHGEPLSPEDREKAISAIEGAMSGGASAVLSALEAGDFSIYPKEPEGAEGGELMGMDEEEPPLEEEDSEMGMGGDVSKMPLPEARGFAVKIAMGKGKKKKKEEEEEEEEEE